VQQCRTSINKLKSTGELTDQSTNSFRLITVINYDCYQTNQQTNQQASNRRVTANKEREEYNNISKDNIIIESTFFKILSEYENNKNISDENINKIKDMTN